MKFLHTNTTDSYQYPQGKALPPGESIELDSDQCPEFLPENKFGTRKVKAGKKKTGDDGGADDGTGSDDASTDLQLKTFLGAKSKDLIAQLKAAKPGEIKPADLDRLEVLEAEAADPRSTVLAAIAETKLRFASEAEGAK